MFKGLISIPIWLILALFFRPAFADDGEFLYLDPFLDMSAYKGEIEVYTEDYKVIYVATESLKAVLQVAITVVDNDISGWFFFQNNRIKGRMDDSQIAIADKSFAFSNKSIIEREGAWYVEVSALTRWFEMQINVDINRLFINFETTGRHPMFEAMKRKARYGQIDAAKYEEQQITTIDNRYQLFTTPASDIRVSHKLSQNGSTDILSNTVFDALSHSVNVLGTVNNGQSVVRFKAERESELSGQPFNYQLGDIYFPAGKFLRASFSGRGIALHGNTLSQKYAKSFIVEGVPGWQIELYRENQLIDYSKLDERGQYTFEGVDVNAGFNNYKVLLYGPNGEIEEKQYRFNVSKQGLQQGSWQPEFYFIEPDVATIGPSDNSQSTFKQAVIGHLNYGMSDNINLGFGGVYDLSDSAKDTPFAEFLFSDSNHRVDIGVAAPKLENQLSYSFDYTGNLDWGIFRLSKYKNYAYAQQSFQSGALLGWQHMLDDLDMGISMTEQVVQGDKLHEFDASMGFQMENSNVGGRVNYVTSSNYTAAMVARFVIDQHLFQLSTSYTKSTNKNDKKLNLAWRKKFGTHNVVFNSNYSTNNKQFTYSSDYSTDFNGFKLGARLARSADNNWSFALSISTALVWDSPLSSMTHRSYAGSARLKTRAYWDRNNNQTFDGNDEPIAGVKYQGAPAWRDVKSDEQGVAVLSGARSYYPQYMEVDTADLDNPFMSPKVEQFKVITHPGAVVSIDVPFYEQFEVEGDVKALDDNNKLKGLSSVPVLLMQADEIIQQTKTEYDGYFLFDKVLPGVYQIEIGQAYLDTKAMQMTVNQDLVFELASGGDPLMMLGAIMLIESTN